MASIFIYSKLGRDVLEKLPALKLIATRSTGYDHIDTGYCAEHGITVSNVPTYGENTVAEHVFALLLAISHRLPEAITRARSGHFTPEGLEGFDLQGKTLGVIGTGNIGIHVIRIARGFGMKVLGFDVKPQAAARGRIRLYLRAPGRAAGRFRRRHFARAGAAADRASDRRGGHRAHEELPWMPITS